MTIKKFAPEDFVEPQQIVGIGTNRTILAHQLLDLIESKGAQTPGLAMETLDEIYGILIQITGRPTMADNNPELVNKVVEFENPKRDSE